MNNGLVVRNVIFINRAPFENLDLQFIEGINVLSSENGRGKTTIMSYIVDALYEIAKETFSHSFDGHNTAFYRISSGVEVLDARRVSLVYIRFSFQGDNVDYIDARGQLTREIYNALPLPPNPISFSEIVSHELPGNVRKFCHFFGGTKKKEIFSEHLATYFPAYRYELPAYLNNVYQPSNSPFNQFKQYIGVLPNPIEVVEGVENISNWLLDGVLDWKVNEDKNPYHVPGGGVEIIDKTLESILWNNVCEVLQWTLFAKLGSRKKLRFGIGRRHQGNSRVAVMGVLSDGSAIQLCPSISYLSSGEKGLLCIFGEILRQADCIHQNIQVDQIDGLVMVDEIDKHLHIRQQKEALPRLFNNFFNVQFIISSHSPFLNMGLADHGRLACQIIDLDSGGVVCEPRHNELYNQVYEMMLQEKAGFAREVEGLRQRLATMTKTVVITEGKTDIIHINKAKEKLGVALDYDVVSPDNQPDGDRDLLERLKQVAKTPNAHKIIGVFDSDTSTTKDFAEPYQSFGNNVYAFKIQSPKKRADKGQTDISIEYLYSDNEVKTMLPNGTRLFFGTEFSAQTNRSLENPDLCLTRSNFGGSDKIIENTGKQAVYDAQGNNYLAKKSDFAQAIADETIEISEASWENFRHIFDMIETINNL